LITLAPRSESTWCRRARDRKSEIEHRDAVQGAASRRPAFNRRRGLVLQRRRLGLDRLRVLAQQRRRPADLATARIEPVGDADLAVSPQLRILRLPPRIRPEGIADRSVPPRASARPGSSYLRRPRPRPIHRRKLAHGLRKDRLIVRHHQQLFGPMPKRSGSFWALRSGVLQTSRPQRRSE